MTEALAIFMNESFLPFLNGDLCAPCGFGITAFGRQKGYDVPSGYPVNGQERHKDAKTNQGKEEEEQPGNELEGVRGPTPAISPGMLRLNFKSCFRSLLWGCLVRWLTADVHLQEIRGTVKKNRKGRMEKNVFSLKKKLQKTYLKYKPFCRWNILCRKVSQRERCNTRDQAVLFFLEKATHLVKIKMSPPVLGG